MLREILEKMDGPSTVISGVMSADLDKAIKLLNKAGFKASVYQGEYIGIKGASDAKAKANMQSILDGKIAKGFDISESCSKDKKEEGVSFSPTYTKMKKKVDGAKPGDCEKIEKEIFQLHKEQKLTSGDFDELEAAIYRKKQSLKKSEADGGYGDLGAIPSAPSNLGKKKPDHFIVSGEIRDYLK